jgi:delta 1-pyrroline-5-carboxylate dehydrogenase
MAAAEMATPKPGIDEGPDLVEPSRPFAAQGLSGTVERAMGPVALPTLLELVDALDDVAQHASAMNDIDPAMSEVALAVLSDEQAKVMRYLDLRDR